MKVVTFERSTTKLGIALVITRGSFNILKILRRESLASFPGPARSSLAVRNSRRGPGNEASESLGIRLG